MFAFIRAIKGCCFIFLMVLGGCGGNDTADPEIITPTVTTVSITNDGQEIDALQSTPETGSTESEAPAVAVTDEEAPMVEVAEVETPMAEVAESDALTVAAAEPNAATGVEAEVETPTEATNLDNDDIGVLNSGVGANEACAANSCLFTVQDVNVRRSGFVVSTKAGDCKLTEVSYKLIADVSDDLLVGKTLLVNSSRISFEIGFPPLRDGIYRLEISAFNSCGCFSQSTLYTFVAD